MLDKMQISRQNKHGMTVAFMLGALMLTVFSYAFYANPKSEPDFEKKRMLDIADCMTFARSKGLKTIQPKNSTEPDRVLEITTETLDEPAFMMANVESVLLACSNIEAKSICLGEKSECGVDGLKIIMVYAEPKVFD